MTISSTTNRVNYTGNGVTTAFAFPYKFLANADLKVYQEGTLKTITTHYTVTGAGDDAGGTVTFLVAPANLDDVVIIRDPAILQGLDLVENDPLPAEDVENALDKLTIICQRLQDQVSRSLILSDAETDTVDVVLPAASARKALIWNATADGVINSIYDPDEQVAAAAASAAAASASAAAAAASEAVTEAANIVLGYGADPTGSADSTSAIQNAVDSGLSIIYVPAGRYKILGTVNITAPIRIIGSGTSYAMTGAAVCEFYSTSTTNTFVTINADDVVIEGIDMPGQGGRAVSGTVGTAIQVGTVARAVTDAAMTATVATLTSATAAFTTADVGSYVSVAGAYNGTSTAYITAYISATQVTLNAVADNTVSGAAATIAPVIIGSVFRDISTASQSVGIDFQNASNFTIDNCHLNGFYALKISSVAPDKGDSQIIGSHLSAPTTSGSACIRWLASGGLRVTNTKFLDCYDHIRIVWSSGTSGGPIITGCSFENMVNYAINATGDSASVFNGMVLTGNWFNGGARQVHLADTLPITNFNMSGNVFANGSAASMVYVGALADRFSIASNMFDGANVGSCIGVEVASGAANGLISANSYQRLTTEVSNANASVLVDLYDEGDWTPVITFATPGDASVTYSVQVGKWTRTGRKISASFSIVTSAFTHTTASGALKITGLPFTSAAAGISAGSIAFQGITKATYTQCTPYIAASTDYIGGYLSGSGVALATVRTNEMPSGGTVQLHGSIEFNI